MTQCHRFLFLFIIAAVCLGSSRRTVAQDTQPAVKIMLSGGTALSEDLEYLTLLAGKFGEEQWPMLNDYLETFLEGIDRQKPVRVDVILDDVIRYRSCFPVQKRTAFLENLEAFGLDNRRLKTDLYQLTGEGFFDGYMRLSDGYASIAEKQADIPSDMPDPTIDLKPLTEKECDVAIDIRNEADGLDARRKSFGKMRDELMAAVKKKPGETDADFAFREAFLKTQLAEGERFFAESKQLTLSWTTDVPKKQGRLQLELEALPDTVLQKAVTMFGNGPSRFGAIKPSETSILFGRVNSGIDTERVERLATLSKLLKPCISQRIQASDKRTAAQKEQSASVIDLCFEILDAGIAKANLDGFVDLKRNANGKHSVVGAIEVAAEDRVTEILGLLPKTQDGRTTQVDADKAGNVRFHALTVADADRDYFNTVFGSDAKLYIGTSADILWYAAGENALDNLKATIEVAGAEASGSNAGFEFQCVVGRCLELLNEIRGDKGENVDFRREAIGIFKSVGTIKAELKQDNNRVVGNTIIDEDTLRFVGHMMAKFSAETLQ